MSEDTTQSQQHDSQQATEDEWMRFFDSVVVCDTYEEWLQVICDGEKYQNQAKGLTPIQRKNVKRFAKMMQNCQ
jgi:hypothetical protein